ncbi:AFL235Wp [Eremothecium gossypii ATCC 10895]|uniref:AFL235Wp n=1 Tax=Eremothecium gossypii (strain ATCC 10895 / CBS 109.51 / FGSC 9923 / NRRL Y-1056) TaxID=284811 RepID=Q755P8_EREGS|nr:AFL235Wp [Eremothecium gossypii ATCC 10895]AAS53139.2 AFL235Wp [Eremothecium gossypii ATCC 10895]AEY97449.1 FAFL235Wp [Eremothecium gossypii FDAG1]
MRLKRYSLRLKSLPIVSVLLAVAISTISLGLMSQGYFGSRLASAMEGFRTSSSSFYENRFNSGSSSLKEMFKESEDTSDAPNKEQLCKQYFQLTYRNDPSWSNEAVRESNSLLNDASYTALLIERMRIFADCFMSGDVQLQAVLPEKSDMFEFHQRMYPFLAKGRSWHDIWPTFSDVKTGDTYAPGMLNDGRRVHIDDSVSFWKNWQSFSKGRGIVITAGEEHIQMLLRLLAVLDHLGNTLPIELVLTESPSQERIQKIAHYLRDKTKQSLRIVDCKKILEPSYRPLIFDFRYKWLAYLLNSFEEVVFIDLDVVPFVSIDKFFEMEGYKSTGILMFQDRVFNSIKNSKCRTAIHHILPSHAEQTLWKHQAKYTKEKAKHRLKNFPDDAGAASVYDRYLEGDRMHMVESGLVVVDKRKKISSLIISLMLHMNIAECSYGDKEYLWLGQLVSGEDYYIHPLPPAILGMPQEVKHDNKKKYEVCSTQIAHMDHDGSILWVNGGMQNCKFPEFADSEVESNNEYFSSQHSDKEVLRKFYESPINIQMAFIPNLVDSNWHAIATCNSYTWCAEIKPDFTESSSRGNFIISGNDPRLPVYNEIKGIWMHAPSLSDI